MTKLELKRRIGAAINGLDDDDIVELFNAFCEETCFPDDKIYRMGDFEDVCGDLTAYDLASKICDGKFDLCDDYFRFNGNGDLESFIFVTDENSGISIDDIVDFIVENDCPLDRYEIEEILAENRKEEEESE